MELNDLLRDKKIDPREVLVFRHRPKERGLNKILPWLAADKPDLFNAYQQTQSPRVEKSMTKAAYVASFIGQTPGQATFVGLYKIGKSKRLTRAQFWKVPAFIEMKTKYGLIGFSREEKRSTCLRFNLMLTDFCSSWKGKLIVDWPPPERAWCRRAHKNHMPVRAILEDSALDTATKKWDEIDFTWSQLHDLSKISQAKFEEWQAIYYIFDTSIGKGYVGSAYGSENLYGRWCNYKKASSYASSGHGGNKLLKKRDPQNFRFTILELVAQSMEREDVIRLESKWKKCLHTRKPYGLNDN